MPIRHSTATVALGALLLFGGCEGPGGPGAETYETGPAVTADPLPGSAASLEDLGRRVLHAFVSSDIDAMESVRLTETEHNEVVWPELPASAPELNYPVAFAWQNLEARNFSERRRVEPWYRGRDLTFRGVECEGLERFRTFRVHTGCRLRFLGPEDGEVQAVLFKEVLERNGGFKIFRYYDNDPRPEDSGVPSARADGRSDGSGSEDEGAGEA